MLKTISIHIIFGAKIQVKMPQKYLIFTPKMISYSMIFGTKIQIKNASKMFEFSVRLYFGTKNN